MSDLSVTFLRKTVIFVIFRDFHDIFALFALFAENPWENLRPRNSEKPVKTSGKPVVSEKSQKTPLFVKNVKNGIFWKTYID